MLIEKSASFSIDLNVKDIRGNTAFHFACKCKYGHSKIVEMLIHKSTDFNIDLNGKNEDGKTAFS